RPDPEVDLAGAVRALAEWSLSRDEFLARFGHRGPQEMELSQPRWAEDTAGLPAVSRAIEAGITAPHKQPERFPAGTPEYRWERLLSENPASRAGLERLAPVFRQACEFLRLRESAKHYLLQGYAQIRQALLEIDRWANLNGGVFFLVPDELPRLLAGEPFDAVVAARRRERQLALSIEAPAVIFSDDL